MLHPVQGVTFHVDRGETLCIVGESGCGKSLTALAIMGLLPQEREAHGGCALELQDQTLDGVAEARMADIRGNRMAMIFQEPMTSLNPAYTIGNQLEEALLRHQAGVAQRGARARRAPAGEESASRRRSSGCGSIRISFPAACASA